MAVAHHSVCNGHSPSLQSSVYNSPCRQIQIERAMALARHSKAVRTRTLGHGIKIECAIALARHFKVYRAIALARHFKV